MTSLPTYRPGLAKRRSRRLRKKLHIAEFQELGFEYEITWEHFATASQQEDFLDDWIALIESRDLVLVGGPTSGFIYRRRKIPTRSYINALQDFLSYWTGIQQAVIGKLVDTWYGAYDGADPVLNADTRNSIPTYDEVDPTPPVKPRIEFVEPGSVKDFYELPVIPNYVMPDDFVRTF